MMIDPVIIIIIIICTHTNDTNTTKNFICPLQSYGMKMKREGTEQLCESTIMKEKPVVVVVSI